SRGPPPAPFRPLPSRRRRRSVLVEQALDRPDVGRVQQRQLQQHARLAGFSSPDATKFSLSSSTSLLRSTRPLSSRVLRTTSTPDFTASASVSSAAFDMLPSPTPAITSPLAPFFSAALIRSGLMFECA